MLQVTGLFDSVVVNAIDEAIDRAGANGSQALILQVNSGGAVVSEAEMRDLVQRVADAPVPIGIWVGPASSARLYGTPAQLMGVADVTAMVSGSRVGYTGELFPGVEFGVAADRLENGSLSFQEARTLGALRLDTPDVGVPTIRSMVLAMNDVEVDGVTLQTVTEGVNDEGGAELQATLVRFSKLGLIDQMMHTMASPPVAYLMLLIGLALLIFEFFTAGVGRGRRGRCRVQLLRVLRPGRTARPRLGRGPGGAGDAGVRHRRAGGHPAVSGPVWASSSR